jgi:predicted MFS family arabinose efflux permease
MDFRVLALAVGNFVTACSGMVVVGLLNEIAADLNVSVAVAGLLAAGFAGTSAVVAPIAGILGSRVSRRVVLVAALSLNALSSLASAFVPSFIALFGLRMLVGGTLGTYIPASVSTAGMLARPDQRGRAIFFIAMGASTAQILGVPLGVWFGGITSWRTTLLIFGVIGAAVSVLVWRIIPANLQSAPFSLHNWREMRRNRAILLMLLVTGLQAGGGMLTLSYLAPLLRHNLNATPDTISGLMSIFGLFGFIGSFVGMRIMDRIGARRIGIIALSMVALNFLIWPMASGSFALTALAMGLWGAGFMMIGSSQQTRMVAISPKLAPVSVAFNTSCVFGGSAIGTSIGSATMTAFGITAITWASLGLVLLALALLINTPEGHGQSESDAH